MTEGTDVIAAVVNAARAGDLDALRRLVDWPLTGAASIARPLPAVDEADRAPGVASGLTELDAAATNSELVEEVLRPLVVRLADTREVRRATPQVSQSVLARLQVPHVPPGLTAEQEERLNDLRQRAAKLSQVYVAVDHQGEFPLVHAADTGLVVLVLD
jgi:hypothetical protein